MRDTFHSDLSPYEIIGAPTDVQGAEALKEVSPHQFEWWAADLVNARPAKDHKKGADTGIDGYINFFDDKSGVAQSWFSTLRHLAVTGAFSRLADTGNTAYPAPV